MISTLAYVSPEAKIGKNVTIHPFAYIDRDVVIGDDCVIMPYASVMAGTRMGKGNKVFQHAVLGAEPQDLNYNGEDTLLMIGNNNHIRENVVVARSIYTDGRATTIGDDNFLMDKVHICHDAIVGNHCVAGIGTTLAGECILDDCTILSGNVVLYQRCHVGSWSLIQGGSRISKDIPPYVIISGNPPTYHGVNASVMMKHNQTPEKILRHIVNAYRLVFQGNFSLHDALNKIEDQVPMSEEIQSIIDFCKNSKQGIVK